MEKKGIVLIAIAVLAVIVFLAMQLTGNVVINPDGSVQQQFPSNPPSLGEETPNLGDESADGGSPIPCGDGICSENETSLNCPQDCTVGNVSCGDGICGEGENYINCSPDCSAVNATCGDGVCDLNLNESTMSCAADCNFSGNENQTDVVLDGSILGQGGDAGGSGESAERRNTEISAVIRQLEERGVQVYLKCDDSGNKVMIFGQPPVGYEEPEDCDSAYLSPTGRAVETTQTVRDYVFGRIVGGLFGL